MSKITPALLKALAPNTKAELRDRFIPNLNLTLPAYGIDTELEVACFLATACFESDYFKTMREYGKGKGRRYGVATGPYKLIYYGRGIFQNTWLAGYQKFTAYVKSHWSFIQPRAGIANPPDFVKDPELLATTFWAVEAACWYWEENHLAKYAKQGLDGFFALQGLVNRGSATKKALDYDDRLMVYKRTLAAIPDDFKLDQAAAPNPTANSTSEPETLTGDPSASLQNESSELPLVNSDVDNGKIGVSPDQNINIEKIDNANLAAPPPPPSENPVEVEKVVADEGIVSKVKAWYGAVSGGASAAVTAFLAWLAGASTVIIISLFSAVTVITAIWLIQKYLKEKEAGRQQLEREKMAHELTVLQVQSAMSTTQNTVIVK